VLDILAKKDTQWRKIAFNICKDKYLADDLVNDMYLALANNEKASNDFYVIIVIRNLFLHHTKTKKEVNIEDIVITESINNFEINDEQLETLTNLKWWEKELLELSFDYSLRELEKKYNINYAFIHRTIKRIRNEQKQKTK
jgi:DNA-directed RNA polymerase specialized sigma24 family protein